MSDRTRAEAEIMADLENAIQQAGPELSTLAMVKIMFAKTAEIDATVNAMLPVVGAIAGRVGISSAEIARLTGTDDD